MDPKSLFESIVPLIYFGFLFSFNPLNAKKPFDNFFLKSLYNVRINI